MSTRNTLFVSTLILLVTAHASAALKIRIEGGWSFPASELKSKTYVARSDEVTFQAEFQAEGKHCGTVEAAIGLGRVPFQLVLSSGVIYFDDVGWEIEETTHVMPLGTGRFSDFQHRIIPITVGIEYLIGYAARTSTSLGFGAGFYKYTYINRGEYRPELELPESKTWFGWHLGLVQFARLSQRVGLCLDVDYHSMNVGGQDAVGFAPEGFIKRVAFYRIQLGVVIQAIH